MGKIKAKGKRKNPKLSLVDKIIYIVLSVLALFSAIFFMAFTGANIPVWADFLGDNGIAFYGGSYIWGPVLYVCLPLSAVSVVFISGLGLSFPIFGRRDITYGKGIYETHPLFSSKRWNMSDRKKKLLKRKLLKALCICVLCIVFVIVSLPVMIYPRDVLNYDMSVEEYGIFNRLKEVYRKENVSELHFISYYNYAFRGAGSYTYRIDIYMDDGSGYEFSAARFDCEEKEILEFMLKMKNSFPDNMIFIEMQVPLSEVADGRNMSPSETRLLYELFSQ